MIITLLISCFPFAENTKHLLSYSAWAQHLFNEYYEQYSINRMTSFDRYEDKQSLPVCVRNNDKSLYLSSKREKLFWVLQETIDQQ